MAGEFILCAGVEVENVGAITAEVKGDTQLVAHILQRGVGQYDILYTAHEQRRDDQVG